MDRFSVMSVLSNATRLRWLLFLLGESKAAEGPVFVMRNVVWVAIFCLVCLLRIPSIDGQDLFRLSEIDSVSIDNLNFKLKTLGGKQFWTDIQHCGGWRIQENAVSGHCRLLDRQNRRHSWGSLDECRLKLSQMLDTGEVRKLNGRVVIVLHGLIRTTSSMQKLGAYIQDNSEFSAVNFEYASTRKRVAEHAKALANVIDSLSDDVTEVNFVAHSMGNIVVRHYLADTAHGNKTRKFGRMVMIGPPNQGSRMANVLKRSFLFNVIAGPAGWELGAGWEKLEPKLATPEFEFGIIAGGQSDRQKISNFILNGKDDFTVSVEETKLPGATDFLVKPLLHSTMMRQPVTLEATLRFLENGHFVSEQKRHPIPKHKP